jgi:hypothetical protein
MSRVADKMEGGLKFILNKNIFTIELAITIIVFTIIISILLLFIFSSILRYIVQILVCTINIKYFTNVCT